MVAVFGGHGEAGDVEATAEFFEVTAAVVDACVARTRGFNAFL